MFLGIPFLIYGLFDKYVRHRGIPARRRPVLACLAAAMFIGGLLSFVAALSVPAVMAARHAGKLN
jgi:hypothetical protein